jgi:hypothetical protein
MEYTIGKGLNENGRIIRQIMAWVPSSQAVAAPGKSVEEEGMD